MAIRGVKSLYLLIILSIAGFIAACATPPFGLTVSEVNEKGPQQKAVIQLSDAQVYARETLVNDRREEVQYLNTLLKESETINFEPQLLRDIRTIQTLSAQLGLKFDPAGGKAFTRQDDLDELQAEIDKTRLQIELEKIRQELQKLQASQQNVDQPATPDSASNNTPAGKPAEGASGQETEFPGLTESGKIVSQLNTLISSTQALLDKRTADVRASKAKASPIEEFRDRQAYRAELRSALATVNLDDVHDNDGNALYRLQFNATVAPGIDKDRWGVARVTAFAPDYASDDIYQLYHKWLSHLALRMNEQKASGAEINNYKDVNLYRSLAYSSRLFNIIEIAPEQELANKNKDVAPVLYVPVPFHESSFIELLSRRHLLQQLGLTAKTWGRLRRKSEFTNFISEAYGFSPSELLILKKEGEGMCREFIHQESEEKFSDLMDTARKNHKPGQRKQLNKSLEWRLQRDGDYFEFPRQQKTKIKKYDTRGFYTNDWSVAGAFRASKKLSVNGAGILKTVHFARIGRDINNDLVNVPVYEMERNLSRAVIDANRYIDLIKSLNPSCASVIEDDLKSKRRNSVGDFKSFIIEAFENSRVRSYGAAPSLQAQRLSTLASAANAVELGLALNAAKPASGIGATGGLGFARQTAGNIEALERVPLVAGYSHRTVDDNNKEHAQFGWIFGPTVRVDAKNNKLTLRHTVAHHKLWADLSIPGWWPSIKLRLETAWVGNNWQNAGSNNLIAGKQMASCKKHDKHQNNTSDHAQYCEDFTVSLPLNRTDLDTLTAYLFQKTIGYNPEHVHITKVLPKNISLCSNKVVLLIQGSNVWRSSQAFLDSLEAESLKVLPDMDGVAATFDISRLPVRPNNSPAARLTLWTRDGTDSIGVTLTGKKEQSGCSESSPGSPARSTGLAIGEISPSTIHACSEKIIFVAKGKEFSSKDAVALLGSQPVKSKGIKLIGDKRNVMSLEFDGPLQLAEGQKEIMLTFANADGLASKSVTITGDAKTCKKKTAPKQPTRKSNSIVISRVSPSHINPCATSAHLTIEGKKLATDKAEITFGINKVAAKDIKSSNKEQLVSIKVDGPFEAGPLAKSMPITFANQHGLATAEVHLDGSPQDCK